MISQNYHLDHHEKLQGDEILNVRALEEEGIVIVEPSGKLQETDFEKSEKELIVIETE